MKVERAPAQPANGNRLSRCECERLEQFHHSSTGTQDAREVFLRENRLAQFCKDHRKHEIALHFEDGCGSLWTCAWLRARQAVKTVTAAVDAATADNPRAGARAGVRVPPRRRGHRLTQRRIRRRRRPLRRPGRQPVKAIHQAAIRRPRPSSRRVERGRGCAAGDGALAHMEDVCAPVGRAVAGGCGRRLRALRCVCRSWSVESARGSGTPTRRDTGNCWARWAMLAVFGYFCVSSFVRREGGNVGARIFCRFTLKIS